MHFMVHIFILCGRVVKVVYRTILEYASEVKDPWVTKSTSKLIDESTFSSMKCHLWRQTLRLTNNTSKLSNLFHDETRQDSRNARKKRNTWSRYMLERTLSVLRLLRRTILRRNLLKLWLRHSGLGLGIDKILDIRTSRRRLRFVVEKFAHLCKKRFMIFTCSCELNYARKIHIGYMLEEH